jgi:hypothetical protein
LKVELDVLGYGLAASRELPLPAQRVAPLPPPRFHSRKARLPGLASELAQRALGEVQLGASGSVLFGTALGCLTETAAFVENLFEYDGASPKPRAFTASVHNAIASEVARKLGARGECQTFVQGELSHVGPLFAAARARARGLRGPWLVGALDEWTTYVARGRAASDDEGPATEGGALLHLTSRGAGGPALARVTEVGLARPVDPRAWVDSRRERVDAVLTSGTGLELGLGHAVDATPLTGDFPASGALALGLGCAVLAEELEPAVFGLRDVPRSLGILSTSRFGEWGWVALEAPRS